MSMEPKKTVLIVEDEMNIVDIVRFNLQREGYATLEAYDGEAGLALAREKKPDLILLDVMMPKMMGFDVCRALRAEGDNVPVIILTAREEEEDKILGLEIGADDYITKPFDPVEVLARVKSQLRRYTLLGAKPETAPERGIYTVGGVTLNEDAKSVTVDGESVSLTPLEFNILQLLIRSPGRIYSSSQIYELVWNENSLGAETSVAVHIRHLRQKIEINPSEPRYLKVVWGLGYKMEDLRHEKE